MSKKENWNNKIEDYQKPIKIRKRKHSLYVDTNLLLLKKTVDSFKRRKYHSLKSQQKKFLSPHTIKQKNIKPKYIDI